jgi:class 3 adenylate cyclase
MPPEEAVELLNEHMSAMTRVVHEHGGVVDKFVGDMIMAVFGARRDDPQAPARAAACARHMIAERGVLNMLTGREINIGIGIATGKMLAGFMGSEDRLNFTVIGQGANLASRLCTVAAPMEILMDEVTSVAIEEKDEMLPPLEIKGFAEPQAVFRLKTGEKGELAPSIPRKIPVTQ